MNTRYIRVRDIEVGQAWLKPGVGECTVTSVEARRDHFSDARFVAGGARHCLDSDTQIEVAVPPHGWETWRQF